VADQFLARDALVDAVADAAFDRPPALVCNAHVTGLGVARALAARDVPVVAVDRTGDGVAPPSDAVALAGRVTYPLDDEAGFRADVATLADACDHDPVAFGCMDEWALAFARSRPAGVCLPFAADRVDAVLDKTSLYAVAEDLDVPYPETYRIAETDDRAGPLDRLPAREAAERLGYPLVVKPARKRRFEEAVGTNVLEVAGEAEYEDAVAAARDAGVRVMAQERVETTTGGDRSFASYVSPDGGVLGVVGAPTRYPRGYGTSCLVERVEAPSVERRARAVLAETGYHGVSEAEFVHDAERDDHLLLDVNTRPWKWIGLPVATGADLPGAAYADAVGEAYDPEPTRGATWVFLRDYLALLAAEGRSADRLTEAQWTALVSGAFVDDPTLATGVYRPDDPGPTRRLLDAEFGERTYYCAC
jgi:predicted ATP-grasp superfamily ATP-dependent carboligase